MAVLHVLRAGWRANLEEQDDPVLWIVQVLQNNGGAGDVLLRGTAAGYVARGQDARGVVIGGVPLAHPPDVPRDLGRLVASGAKVYAVRDDVVARGIRPDEVVPGVTLVASTSLAALLRAYDAVWHW